MGSQYFSSGKKSAKPSFKAISQQRFSSAGDRAQKNVSAAGAMSRYLKVKPTTVRSAPGLKKV